MAPEYGTIENQMRSKMAYWETHEPALEDQFEYLISKFGGTPEAAKLLLKVAGGHVNKNYEADTFSIDISHRDEKSGQTVSSIGLEFIPSCRLVVVKTSTVINLEKKILGAVFVFDIKEIHYTGPADNPYFRFESKNGEFDIDTKEGTVISKIR